jgi:predicted transcriptional regulator
MLTNIDHSILLSIRPEFAQKIYAGEKRIELRKIFAKNHIRYIFLFETNGIRKVTGFFEPGVVITDKIDSLWDRAKRFEFDKGKFKGYFASWQKGSIIEIRSAVRLAQPLDLHDILKAEEKFKIPQGFIYLDRFGNLKKLLLTHLKKQRGAFSEFRLEKIASSDYNQFRRRALKFGGDSYDDIREDFVDKLIDCTETGYDPYGYFTESKTVYNIVYNGQKIGYTTLTGKRGNSVKTGPTILLEQHRGKGLGRRFRGFLDELLRSRGVRKVYCTCPDSSPAIMMYLIHSHYRIEAHCFNQYSATHGDLIFGKLLKNNLHIALRLQRAKYALTRVSINRLTIPIFLKYFRAQFSKYYFPVDASFARTLVRSMSSLENNDLFYKKRKIVYVGYDNRIPHSLAILSPKRGGAFKLTFVFKNSSIEANRTVIQQIEKDLKELDAQKLFVSFPCQDREILFLFKGLGYMIEGTLTEPYQDGVDFLQMAKFI